MSSGELSDRPINPSLLTLNPSNAAIVTRIATTDFYHSLAVRPTDGVIFGGTADERGC